MNGFRRVGNRITAKFSPEDATDLANRATQLAALVAERGEPGSDPAIDRLLPDAYRESPDDASEFRRFTEADIADDKVRAALDLAEALEVPAHAKTVAVTLELEQAIAWMRSLNDLRLTLAMRVGIDDNGEPADHTDEGRYGYLVYEWLGALLESLVRAVDK